MQTFKEQIAMNLRTVYETYGYIQYRMSKFEEYDLYARNKDFLVSDNVLTFTDISGKLMALKPDVTLSIVKNTRDLGVVQKLYYNENVYRVAKGAQGYQEIMQLGLECLGPIDGYCISEVLMLAAKSLNEISPEAVLDISHLGLLCQMLESVGIPAELRGEAMHYIGEKNLHDLSALCAGCAVVEEDLSALRKLISLKANLNTATYDTLTELLAGRVDSSTVEEFISVLKIQEASDIASALRIDLSVVDDIHYYNGFVFKGFVKGLPGNVLTGGQYDTLMKKMKRTDGAIGFVVYTDMLDRLEQPSEDFDVDVLLAYGNAAPAEVVRQVKALTAQGKRVMAQRTVPTNIRYREILTIGEVDSNA
jgi:ATP phosphoribosyltransferase regulatory subunit